MGRIGNRRRWSPVGADPPALFGSRDAPTTAIAVAASRISWDVLLLISMTKRPARRHIPRAHAQQRLAGRVPADLLARESIAARLPTLDGACGARRDEHVRRVPHPMCGREWRPARNT